MTQDGWIPVDPLMLETRFPGVYAVGDVTSVGTPKAGVFAEGQAKVVAERIAAQLRDGNVGCRLRRPRRVLHGIRPRHDRQGRRDVHQWQRPVGRLEGPSVELVRDKTDFGSRVQRWFGRTWHAV